MAPATVAVFGSSRTRPGEPDYQAGMRCGRLLAEAGYRVVTGGYGGLMEAVSRGAAEAGGTVLAVTAPQVFPGRTGANSWVHHDEPQPTIARRIAALTDDSIATIALPGSIGTFTELLMSWNEAYLDERTERPVRPVIAVGGLWADLVAYLAPRIGAAADLIDCVPDVDAAVTAVISLAGPEA